MWDYRLGDRYMVIYWTIGLGTETWSGVGLQAWGQRHGQVWDYRLGDRDMVMYWTIGLGTETWSCIGL